MATPSLDEHSAIIDVTHKAQHCPHFQKGCPYASNEGTFDLASLKNHPVFAQGCPYKKVDVGNLKDCPAFKDHKCPFDGSHKVDVTRINQCPAFKGGCPYSKMGHIHDKKHDHGNMNTHVATGHIAAEATKCPIFAHANCPFDPKHPHGFDLSKIKECPAFQRAGGSCPFKGVHVERLQECPAFKDGKCPFDGSKQVDLTRLKECPAFQKGCPYSHLHAQAGAPGTQDLHTFMVDTTQHAQQCPFFSKEKGCPYDPEHARSFDLSKVKDCPAFTKTAGDAQCPYKNMTIPKLDECPAFKDGKCPFDGKSAVDLTKLKECPAFNNGCPYKALEKKEGETTTTTTTTTTAASPAPPAGHAHPEGDAAKCPFHAMHGKGDNPHK